MKEVPVNTEVLVTVKVAFMIPVREMPGRTL